MTDDKPTLTRRRMLGGVATIGIAGALGASTWAQLSDTENGQATVTAGTLDLVVGNEGEPFVIDIGPVQNGKNYTSRMKLTNEGNIQGTHLAITYPDKFTRSENGIEEPEDDLGDTGPDGELLQYLNTRVWVEQENGSVIREFFFSQKDFKDLADCAAETFYIKLPKALPSSEYDAELHVQHKVDEKDLSKAMGDSVSYELDVTLYDTDPR